MSFLKIFLLHEQLYDGAEESDLPHRRACHIDVENQRQTEEKKKLYFREIKNNFNQFD